jgi:uncharacterized protein YdaU (DUF1376 family)
MRRDSLPLDWYPFFVTDYRRDTYHLSLEEDGAYRRLIDEYMVTRQPLPNDDAALARIVGIPKTEWDRLARVVRRFFHARNDRLFHRRCEREIRAQNNRHNRNSEKAQKGGLAKALKYKTLASTSMLGSATLQYKRITSLSSSEYDAARKGSSEEGKIASAESPSVTAMRERVARKRDSR